VSDLTPAERNDIVRGLLQELDLHGPGEREHAERVAVYSVATGHELGMDEAELLALRYAATLHDVGKVRVDADLVNKLGRLSEEELQEMRRHAELSLEVLEQHDWLHASLPMIIHHHERWDGNGYPTGLPANLIPLGARIIAVAEVFDTLVAGPAWKARVSEADAVEELRSCAGTQFDPEVVAAFQKVQPLIQPVSD
jgi:HD-GYP domain-containing protein (c-di-GMP phosphodiesterase class II)